jgi:hypothetical protein
MLTLTHTQTHMHAHTDTDTHTHHIHTQRHTPHTQTHTFISVSCALSFSLFRCFFTGQWSYSKLFHTSWDVLVCSATSSVHGNVVNLLSCPVPMGYSSPFVSGVSALLCGPPCRSGYFELGQALSPHSRSVASSTAVHHGHTTPSHTHTTHHAHPIHITSKERFAGNQFVVQNHSGSSWDLFLLARFHSTLSLSV